MFKYSQIQVQNIAEYMYKYQVDSVVQVWMVY